MSDQKNIDNLFRETFENFEASPDTALWDKISDRLDAQEKKKKKEGIVFLPWLYRFAGIAAALLLLFFVGNEFVNTNNNIIDTDEQTTSTTKEDSNSTKNNNETTSNTEVTDTNLEKDSSNNTNSSADKVVSDQERMANENGVDNKVQKGNALQNEVVQQNGTNTNVNSTSQKVSNSATNIVSNNKLIHKENAVTQNSNNKTNTSKNGIENGVNSTTTNTNAVAQNSNNKTSTSKNGIENSVNSATTTTNAVAQNSNNKTDTSKNGIENGVNSATTTTNAVAQNANNKTDTSKNGIENSVNSATTTTNAVAQNNTSNSSNTQNSSTTDATKTAETATTVTAVAAVKKKDEIKKSLLDVINDLHDLEKDTEVAEMKRKKWTISPNASPIYYNSISSGSPIDETFADNTKTGNVNLSYGVNVGYDVSKRLTVRSGIHKVDYSYNTQDISLVPSINGNDLTTIAFRTNTIAFDIKDRPEPSNIVYSQYQLPSSESSIQVKQIDGNLNQRMSYIEVPVELKYAVLDTKFGINVIGGVSTLLLTENSILLDSPELYTELGEATNINDVSFSTNIGVGIDYKISDQLEFNVEPMLKYQLNTFSGDTGNFKPYSVGVYTGVSFRF